MMHSPLMRLFMMISWAVTALVAINIGLIPFGYDIFMAQMFMNNPGLTRMTFYFIGLCGVYSLVLMIMAVNCKCGKCENCKKK